MFPKRGARHASERQREREREREGNRGRGRGGKNTRRKERTKSNYSAGIIINSRPVAAELFEGHEPGGEGEEKVENDSFALKN